MHGDCSDLTCQAPEFAQIAHGVWGVCIRCQRLAWEHEQADPLADILNFRQRRDFSAPPVMLTAEQWRRRHG